MQTQMERRDQDVTAQPIQRAERAPAQPVALRERHRAVPIDVYESTDELLVVADLPGVTAESLQVNVEAGRLEIRGCAADSEDANSPALLCGRTLQLPDTVAPEAATAELRHGVLRVHLPKRDEVKPRRIEIRTE